MISSIFCFHILSLTVEVYLRGKLQASVIFLSERTCTTGGWLNTFLPNENKIILLHFPLAYQPLLVALCFLKQICHDYNNGYGTFGLCQGGYGCKRVHICERFLNHNCRCSRNHDFTAPQPLRALQGVPEHLIHSLKSAYANIQAMKNQDEKGKHGGDSENKAQRRQPGTKMAASVAPDIDAGSSNS